MFRTLLTLQKVASISVTYPDAISGGWPSHYMIPVEISGYLNMKTNNFISTNTLFIDPAWSGGLRNFPGDIWYNSTSERHNTFGYYISVHP